jgi:hypothetical protein
MKTLDLHGMYHDTVERHVENFVLLNESPLRIITGNSDKMKEIVVTVLTEHDFKYYPENYTNFGSLIVIDKTRIVKNSGDK